MAVLLHKKFASRCALALPVCLSLKDRVMFHFVVVLNTKCHIKCPWGIAKKGMFFYLKICRGSCACDIPSPSVGLILVTSGSGRKASEEIFSVALKAGEDRRCPRVWGLCAKVGQKGPSGRALPVT